MYHEQSELLKCKTCREHTVAPLNSVVGFHDEITFAVGDLRVLAMSCIAIGQNEGRNEIADIVATHLLKIANQVERLSKSLSAIKNASQRKPITAGNDSRSTLCGALKNAAQHLQAEEYAEAARYIEAVRQIEAAQRSAGQPA